MARRETRRGTYRGVYWSKKRQVWRAQIYVNGKLISVGTYEFPAEAAVAYDLAAINAFGASALTNVKDGMLTEADLATPPRTIGQKKADQDRVSNSRHVTM